MGTDDSHSVTADVVAYFRPVAFGALTRVVVTYPDVPESSAKLFYDRLLADLVNRYGAPTGEPQDLADVLPESRLTETHAWALPDNAIRMSLNMGPTRPPDMPLVTVAYSDPRHDPQSQRHRDKFLQPLDNSQDHGPTFVMARDSAQHRVSQRQRQPSELFNTSAFGGTVVALVLAPIVAELNLAGSYLPFLALRLWVVGFSVYGYILAGRAGGLRRTWRGLYGVMIFVFVFVSGLEVETWALIDWTCAALVGASAFFLRTEMSKSPNQ